MIFRVYKTTKSMFLFILVRIGSSVTYTLDLSTNIHIYQLSKPLFFETRVSQCTSLGDSFDTSPNQIEPESITTLKSKYQELTPIEGEA